jgi:hypothetical protein
MARGDRIDKFEGTQAEYTAYLEKEVRRLRQQLSKSSEGQLLALV